MIKVARALRPIFSAKMGVIVVGVAVALNASRCVDIRAPEQKKEISNEKHDKKTDDSKNKPSGSSPDSGGANGGKKS